MLSWLSDFRTFSLRGFVRWSEWSAPTSTLYAPGRELKLGRLTTAGRDRASPGFGGWET